MIITIFILLCTIGLPVAGSLTFWPVHQWYDFYIPLVLAIAGFILGIALSWIWYSFIGLFVSKKSYKKPNKFFEFFLNQLISFGVAHSGARVKVIGKEKLPKKGTYVLVCNHRSNFDSIVISAKFGYKHIAFIAKEANFKIPLASKLMWASCYLPINRKDLLQSLQVMKNAAELVHSGTTSIGVFPEGTRQQEKVIGDFHEGVFNIALKGQVPLVVCTVKGTYDIHKNFPFKKTPVTITFIDTIPYEELEGQTAKAISDKVKAMMIENLQ